MNPRPVQIYAVSSDEFSYLVHKFNIDVVPGLAQNTLSTLSEPDHELATKIIEHSLIARNYLVYDSDGIPAIEPQFESVIRLMIRCAYVMVMTAGELAGPSPEVTICFISPDVVISEVLPVPFVHNIAVFLEQIDFAQDILNLTPAFSGQSQSIDIMLPRSDWENFLDTLEEVDGANSTTSDELEVIRQAIAQATFGIDLSLSSLLDSVPSTKTLLVRCTGQSCVLVFDDNALWSDGSIHIQSATRADLQNALRDWLLPIDATRNVSTNG